MTTDGGRTWSPANTGLQSVVRLKTYGTSAVFAVGADANCRPSYAWTTGLRQPWQRDSAQLSDKWYRVPQRLDTVHAPGGDTSRPCGAELVDLAGLGTYRAAALCGDGRLRTIAEGQSWKTVEQDSGVVALNADDLEFVAAGVGKGCNGTAVRRFDGDGNGLKGKAVRLSGRRHSTLLGKPR